MQNFMFLSNQFLMTFFFKSFQEGTRFYIKKCKLADSKQCLKSNETFSLLTKWDIFEEFKLIILCIKEFHQGKRCSASDVKKFSGRYIYGGQCEHQASNQYTRFFNLIASNQRWNTEFTTIYTHWLVKRLEHYFFRRLKHKGLQQNFDI